ncbi:spindle assembly checkpoint protein [Exidia glandulosa HHB12029]|uniref:Spindle assembly checkpoint protein n=1 Tax=Exidia glandulosa HHB12029 TaxID=1314781 RepID=A0A165PS18_EXIGL|nr:spindle assembly checkpoint protein [Exidia glandulosa HHB12029]
MATSAATRSTISLKGSCSLVTEFFKFAVNTILYQRGVYPVDDFHTVKKYGQPLLVTQDIVLERYIDRVLQQVNTWLMSGDVTQLVVVIVAKDSRVPLERWVFDVTLVDEPGSADRATQSEAKPEAKIRDEIRAIMKQIVSTETYLPVISEPTVFEILAYTSDSAEVPAGEWHDSDPLAIEAGKSQQVKLRSFSTDRHRVDTMVAYRYEG